MRSPFTVLTPIRQHTTITVLRRLLLLTIVLHCASSVWLVRQALDTLQQERHILEDKNDHDLRPSDYRNDRMTLICFLMFLLLIFGVSLIGVHLLHQWVILFYGTTGCGLYLLLLMVLYTDQLLSPVEACFYAVFSIFTSGLSVGTYLRLSQPHFRAAQYVV